MTATRLLPLALLLLAGCEGGVDQGERQRALTAARKGMDAVRALPGGKQASFTEVRLVRDATVCGRIDGNDGMGPRAFSVAGGTVAVSDPRDPTTEPPIAARCAGPSRAITSRNAQFSDIDLAR